MITDFRAMVTLTTVGIELVIQNDCSYLWQTYHIRISKFDSKYFNCETNCKYGFAEQIHPLPIYSHLCARAHFMLNQTINLLHEHDSYLPPHNSANTISVITTPPLPPSSSSTSNYNNSEITGIFSWIKVLQPNCSIQYSCRITWKACVEHSRTIFNNFVLYSLDAYSLLCLIVADIFVVVFIRKSNGEGDSSIRYSVCMHKFLYQMKELKPCLWHLKLNSTWHTHTHTPFFPSH